jgi:hypothetical protein
MMSNDPVKNTDDNNINIDEFASRLVDRDIEINEVPHDLRAAVEARFAHFLATRQQLLDSLPQVESSVIDDAIRRATNDVEIQSTSRPQVRRIGVYFASLAAAAAVVAIVGVAVTQSGSSDQSESDMAATSKIAPEAFSTPLASEAPADMAAESFAPMVADSAEAGAKTFLVINDINELQDLVSEWSVEGFVVPQKAEPLCDDPLRPAIDIETTFAGVPAEIHFSVRDGIVVYRLDNCAMLVGIVP